MPIGWKQCQRHGPFAILIENFDPSTPALALTVVDLSKIKDLPLNDLAAPAAPILHNAPLTMLFAVLTPRMAFQKHYGHLFLPKNSSREEPWSVLQALWRTASFS